MKGRGILFSAPMVRALLAGAKTQTRRAIQPAEPLRAMGSIVHTCNETATGGRLYTVRDPDGNAAWWFTRKNGDREQRQLRCPYGVPGDHLWVRETHAQFAVGNRTRTAPQCVAYRATCDDDGGFDYVNNGDEVMHLKVTKWTPAIFMPRWASRITLEVTEVRVQRLQDISEEDARAEGVAGEPSECAIVSRESLARGEEGCGDCDPCFGSTRIHRPAYERLWDSINDSGSWASNPWVWAISFRKIGQ